MAKSKAPAVKNGSPIASQIGAAMSRPRGKAMGYTVQGTKPGTAPNSAVPVVGGAPNNSTVGR